MSDVTWADVAMLVTLVGFLALLGGIMKSNSTRFVFVVHPSIFKDWTSNFGGHQFVMSGGRQAGKSTLLKACATKTEAEQFKQTPSRAEEAARAQREMGMNLNPNHGVSQELEGQWHKLLAMALLKLGHTSIDLTLDDIQHGANMAITAKPVDAGHRSRIEIRVVTWEEGQRLAREAGGLPS